MKKILLTVIIILLVVLAWNSLAKGISIGSFSILSIENIKQESEKLDTKIEETNNLIDTEYPNKLSNLKTASNKLEQAKKDYLNLTSISTSEDIIKATMEESYDIGLLWTKVGTYARNKGVNVDMSVSSSNTSGISGLYNLNFTVKGSYLAIINFVEAVENDSILNFRIRNFKLLPNDGSILQATFTVSNIAIVGNTSNQNATSNSTSTSTTTTTTTTTNTTNKSN